MIWLGGLGEFNHIRGSELYYFSSGSSSSLMALADLVQRFGLFGTNSRVISVGVLSDSPFVHVFF